MSVVAFFMSFGLWPTRDEVIVALAKSVPHKACLARDEAIAT